MNLQHHCKTWNLFFSILLIWFFSLFINLNISESYYFWLKSADNTPENIEAIENTYNVNLPIVSFIFDPRDENDVLNSIDRIVEKLWANRIYHFTISPDMYSMKIWCSIYSIFQKNKRKKSACNIPYNAWNERWTISTI